MKLMKNTVAPQQREKVGIETVTPEYAKQFGEEYIESPLAEQACGFDCQRHGSGGMDDQQ
jgi:hypothetical protein